jgi:hypothetical protein
MMTDAQKKILPRDEKNGVEETHESDTKTKGKRDANVSVKLKLFGVAVETSSYSV